jgi:hypothetical protein
MPKRVCVFALHATQADSSPRSDIDLNQNAHGTPLDLHVELRGNLIAVDPFADSVLRSLPVILLHAHYHV